MRSVRRRDGVFQPDRLDIAQLETDHAGMGSDIKYINGIALRRLAAVRAMEGEKI